MLTVVLRSHIISLSSLATHRLSIAYTSISNNRIRIYTDRCFYKLKIYRLVYAKQIYSTVGVITVKPQYFQHVFQQNMIFAGNNVWRTAYGDSHKMAIDTMKPNQDVVQFYIFVAFFDCFRCRTMNVTSMKRNPYRNNNHTMLCSML